LRRFALRPLNRMAISDALPIHWQFRDLTALACPAIVAAMPTDNELPSPERPVVSFKRSEVEAAIRQRGEELRELDALRERLLLEINTYTQLLRLLDPAYDMSGVSRVAAARALLRAEKDAEANADTRSPLLDAALPEEQTRKIADHAFEALSKDLAGIGTARDIHGVMVMRGTRVRGAMPMATLTTALRRDSRFERVPDTPNLWRLVAQDQESPDK